MQPSFGERGSPFGENLLRTSDSDGKRQRLVSAAAVSDEQSKEDARPDDKKPDKNDDQNKHETDKTDKSNKPQKPPASRRAAVITIVGAVLLVFILAGIFYWLHARLYVSTDDAYIDGHVVQIAPRVAAQVIALHIDDNQLVRKGDLLIELDPTDFQVALELAQAQLAASQGRLAQAQAQEESARANVNQAAAEVDSAQVILDNANKDFHRYETVDERARSREQYDNAFTTQKNAQAQLDNAKAKKVSADADVSTAVAAIKAAEGDVRTSQANVHRAEVNLGYCRIDAPADGRVTERTVEAGNYVQIGATMFSLVSPEVWVTANFKETQLTHMTPGQPVTISVDAFSNRRFNGHVDSIQAGSGSRFSVLPAENATGNFVKIVQRVPVKIRFDYGGNTNDAGLLSPGLSVIPKVRVR